MVYSIKTLVKEDSMTIGRAMIIISDFIGDLALAVGPMILLIICGVLMWATHVLYGLSPTWGPLILTGGGVFTAITAAGWWVSGAQVWIVMIRVFTAGVWITSAGWLAVILN